MKLLLDLTGLESGWNLSLRNGPSRTYRYDAGSITEENFRLAQEWQQSSWLCQKAGWHGA